MMMPASPAAMASSIALICVVVSPSLEPAETVSFTPSFAASALALFSIEMKYGLVKFFRISAACTGPLALAVLPPLLVPVPFAALPPPQAARVIAAAVPRATVPAHLGTGPDFQRGRWCGMNVPFEAWGQASWLSQR